MISSEYPALVVNDGVLCLPDGDILIRFYPEGDCDIIRADAIDGDNLRCALYAARECGELPPDCDAVALPSGVLFYID